MARSTHVRSRRRAPLLLGALGVVLIAVLLAWAWRNRAASHGMVAATVLPSRATPSVTPTVSPMPTPTAALQQRLERATLPARDDRALARDLGRIPVAALDETAPTSQPYAVGDEARFWIGDAESAELWQISATLRVQLPHVQLWVEAGADVDQAALARSAQAFESRIYPTLRRVFGSEWTPGIDGDPHLVVLNAFFRGASGYFAAANELPRAIYPYSNEREMFVMSLYDLQPGSASYDSVLAHEFQHMIHWNLDANEEGWLQEGASVLAEGLGYDWPAQVALSYAAQPDVQLNAWTDQDRDVQAHYGVSYLFMRYLADRLGEGAIFALVHDARNSLDSVEVALRNGGYSGGIEAFFGDWLVANALDDAALADGRYGYANLDLAIAPQARVQSYPFQERDAVQQYGADYYALDVAALPAGPLRVSFQGEPQVRLVPAAPTSGHALWWSNWGDGANASLERSLDLTDALTATLTYALWYDIERGWDYAYVRASADGGATWSLLRGAHMSEYNPTDGALGPGYTGLSGSAPTEATLDTGAQASWVREELDLSAYCGGQVRVRFDYLTDDAFTRAGLCLDDLEVAAIGWTDDVESGEEGWKAQGFVRVDGALPQRYLVQWVTTRVGSSEVDVQRLVVDEAGIGEWVLDGIVSDTDRAWLIVSAITPWARQPAPYRLTVALP